MKRFGRPGALTVPSGSLTQITSSNLGWYGITARKNGNILAVVQNGDIWEQTAGSGDFAALGQSALSWTGVASDASDDFACVTGGGIYKRAGGSGNFAKTDYATNRTWRSLAFHKDGSLLGATASAGVGILQSFDRGGSFSAYTQSPFVTTGVSVAPNGDVWACADTGGMKFQLRGTGSFAAVAFPASINAIKVTVALNGDVYVTTYSGATYGIYRLPGGDGANCVAGDWVKLSLTNLFYLGITIAPNGTLYTCVNNGKIFTVPS